MADAHDGYVERRGWRIGPIIVVLLLALLVSGILVARMMNIHATVSWPAGNITFGFPPTGETPATATAAPARVANDAAPAIPPAEPAPAIAPAQPAQAIAPAAPEPANPEPVPQSPPLQTEPSSLTPPTETAIEPAETASPSPQ
jgi:hypothetical protein